MGLRIAIWAGVGALVAACLSFYLLTISPTSLDAERPVLALVYLICPIALVRHHPVSFYEVLVVNAATYGLVGAVVETARRCLRIHAISK